MWRSDSIRNANQRNLGYLPGSEPSSVTYSTSVTSQLMLEKCSAIKLANRRQFVILEPAETRKLTKADLDW